MSHEDSLPLFVRGLVQLESGKRAQYDRCLRLVLQEPEDMSRAICLRARVVHVTLRVVTEQAQARIYAGGGVSLLARRVSCGSVKASTVQVGLRQRLQRL
jgi:hypothetical protein